MAEFVFILELAGFQHSDLPFTIKCVSIVPIRNGPVETFTFATPFLLEHSNRAIQTYLYTTRSIHGITLDDSGLPYDIRGDVIQTALKSALFASQRPLPPSYQQSPRILVLTKSTPKIWLLDALIPAEGIFENILIRDVADYGCPPAQQLFGHRAGTDVNFCIVPFPLFSELFSFLSFS